LDLTGCELGESNRLSNYPKILDCCNSLEKLSLRFLRISTKMINKVCELNGNTLQILDLNKCNGVNLEIVEKIIRDCCELKEVNLCDTYLSQDSIKFIVNNITPKVIRG